MGKIVELYLDIYEDQLEQRAKVCACDHHCCSLCVNSTLLSCDVFLNCYRKVVTKVEYYHDEYTGVLMVKPIPDINLRDLNKIETCRNKKTNCKKQKNNG